MSLYVMTTNQVAQIVENAVKEAPSVQVVQVLGTLDIKGKFLLLNTDEAAELIKNTILTAPPDKILETLNILNGYLKCADTELYSCGYREDEKVYHFGRADGLE